MDVSTIETLKTTQGLKDSEIIACLGQDTDLVLFARKYLCPLSASKKARDLIAAVIFWVVVNRPHGDLEQLLYTLRGKTETLRFIFTFCSAFIQGQMGWDLWKKYMCAGGFTSSDEELKNTWKVNENI